MAKRTCSICGGPHYGRGWCKRHYMLWYARKDHRDPALPATRIPVEDRLWAKVNKDGPVPERRPELGPCWIWTAPIAPTARGYPYINVGGKVVAAYRLAYELIVGPIPPGLDLDHLCLIHACVNPAHLEPVPRPVNVQRAWAVRKEALDGKCVNGHEMTPENTYVWPDGKRTSCRTCVRINQARYQERRKKRAALL